MKKGKKNKIWLIRSPQQIWAPSSCLMKKSNLDRWNSLYLNIYPKTLATYAQCYHDTGSSFTVSLSLSKYVIDHFWRDAIASPSFASLFNCHTPQFGCLALWLTCFHHHQGYILYLVFTSSSILQATSTGSPTVALPSELMLTTASRPTTTWTNDRSRRSQENVLLTVVQRILLVDLQLDVITSHDNHYIW